MAKTNDYRIEASDDAADFVLEFIDQVVEKLLEDTEASDDFLNDYTGADSYHHETHVDRSYGLLEAAQLLSDLDDFEESDEGLWEGQSPREAIATQAAYTFGAAVYSMAVDTIKEINDDDTVSGLVIDYNALDALDEDDADDAESLATQIAEVFPGDAPNHTKDQALAEIKNRLTERVKAVIEENR